MAEQRERRPGQEPSADGLRTLHAVPRVEGHLAIALLSVVCLEWIDPVFATGNWGPDLVEIAGGESLLGSPGEHSTTTPWQAVLDANPDVLVVAPCGFGIERTLREMPLLADERTAWVRWLA